MEYKLSKENFIEAIEEIKKSIKYQKDFNNFFKSHDADGCIFQPDCSDALIKILHILFENSDKDNLIYKFCHKTNSGQNQKKDFTTHINTAGDLYDYLTNTK